MRERRKREEGGRGREGGRRGEKGGGREGEDLKRGGREREGGRKGRGGERRDEEKGVTRQDAALPTFSHLLIPNSPIPRTPPTDSLCGRESGDSAGKAHYGIFLLIKSHLLFSLLSSLSLRHWHSLPSPTTSTSQGFVRDVLWPTLEETHSSSFSFSSLDACKVSDARARSSCQCYRHLLQLIQPAKRELLRSAPSPIPLGRAVSLPQYAIVKLPRAVSPMGSSISCSSFKAVKRELPQRPHLADPPQQRLELATPFKCQASERG
jgi:hypothetical protein